MLINGWTHGLFSSTREVRQGDPLSPILFILASKVLSRGLKHLIETKQVGHFSVPSPLSHLAFADDVIIFANAASIFFMETYGLSWAV